MNKARTFRLGLVGLVAALAAGLGGCINPRHMPGADVGLVRVEGMDQELPEGVAPAVDVQNHRGSVTIVVDPTITSPRVKALPMMSGPSLKDVRWTAASMTIDEGRPVLRVLSTPEDLTAPDVPVALTITMPSVGGVRVMNDGGPVWLKDVRGAIEVQNSLAAYEGRAIFLQTREALTDPVLLRADVGDIEVRMGNESQGQIVADARQGRVTVDAIRGNVKDVTVDRGVFRGTLNTGGSEQRITTDTGNVLVLVGIP